METLPSFCDLGRMPRDGERVYVMAKLEELPGAFVAARFITSRQLDSKGICCGWVPGHGGDLHWVRHDDRTEAVYLCSELTPFIPGEAWPRETEAEAEKFITPS